MRTKGISTLLVIVATVALINGSLNVYAVRSANYTKIMQEQLKDILGKQFKKYSFFSAPTDNFGVATTFVLPKGSAEPSEQNQICATFSCVGQAIPEQAASWLSVNGYADVGSGYGVSLTEEEKSQIAIETGLLAVLAKITGNYNREQNTELKLTVGNFRVRTLDTLKLLSYIKSLPNESPIKRAFIEKRLAVATSDVIIESLALDILVKGKTGADVETKLNSNVGKVLKADSNLKFTLSKTGGGHYALSAKQPLVICRLVRKYPIFGTDDFEIKRMTSAVSMQVEMEASIVKRDAYTETSGEHYVRTPGDNCRQTVPFDKTLAVKQGYRLVTASYADARTRGNDTRIDKPSIEDNVAHIRGQVRGDDDRLGFCKRPGEAWFKIAVTGERWVRMNLPNYTSEMTKPAVGQNKFQFAFPHLPPSGDYRTATFKYRVVILQDGKGIPSRIELTNNQQEVNGWAAAVDSAGNLTVIAR